MNFEKYSGSVTAEINGITIPILKVSKKIENNDEKKTKKINFFVLRSIISKILLKLSIIIF